MDIFCALSRSPHLFRLLFIRTDVYIVAIGIFFRIDLNETMFILSFKEKQKLN